MGTIKTVSLETDYKIKLPHDWVKELGLEKGVVIERTSDGILIRLYAAQTWDDIYTKKLRMGNLLTLDLSEVSGDALIF